jgi:hypothetical protein
VKQYPGNTDLIDGTDAAHADAGRTLDALSALAASERGRFDKPLPAPHRPALEAALQQIALNRADKLFHSAVPYGKAASPFYGLYYLGEANPSFRDEIRARIVQIVKEAYEKASRIVLQPLMQGFVARRDLEALRWAVASFRHRYGAFWISADDAFAAACKFGVSNLETCFFLGDLTNDTNSGRGNYYGSWYLPEFIDALERGDLAFAKALCEHRTPDPAFGRPGKEYIIEPTFFSVDRWLVKNTSGCPALCAACKSGSLEMAQWVGDQFFPPGNWVLSSDMRFVFAEVRKTATPEIVAWFAERYKDVI